VERAATDQTGVVGQVVLDVFGQAATGFFSAHSTPF